MSETAKQYQQRVSRAGGLARAKTLSQKQRSAIARKAAQARWSKTRKPAA